MLSTALRLSNGTHFSPSRRNRTKVKTSHPLSSNTLLNSKTESRQMEIEQTERNWPFPDGKLRCKFHKSSGPKSAETDQ
jgi:hypothetical protein